MVKHGKKKSKQLDCDRNVLAKLKVRVKVFLKKHPMVVLNNRWDNNNFLRNVARLGGRCPCDATRPQCPCEFAADEVVKDGKCKCGLFVKWELDEDVIRDDLFDGFEEE